MCEPEKQSLITVIPICVHRKINEFVADAFGCSATLDGLVLCGTMRCEPALLIGVAHGVP
jgi:hypothetical protein